jgi:serine phosphatase RsbU (regulator of sigma subunit)
VNDKAERYEESRGRQAVGHGVAEVMPGFDTEAIEAGMRRVLEDGVAMVDHEFRGILEDDSPEPVLSASFFRLDGPDGRPLGLYSMAVDVSRSWARRRLAVLSEASTRIGSSLDVMSTAQELADLAVPMLADYVTVDLAESVPLGGEPLQRLNSTEVSVPVFRRAGVASIHDGTPESLWPRGEPVFVPPSSPFTTVLGTGRSHFEPKLDISKGTWFDLDPSRVRIIRATGMHSLMIVSLEARGEVLGIAVFVRTENLTPFARDDLLLAEGFADRAALSLDNARRYTHERTAALALQRNLLPRNLTGGRSLEVASSYLPADLHDGVGGDWFDVIPLSGDRVALVVGDVVGHGINAAATMGRLRTAVRTLAYMDLPPDQLLTRLDDLAVRLTDGDDSGMDLGLPDMSATCVYGVYDPATRLLTVALAGHPPPAIVDPDGNVTFPDLPAGAPIGVGLLSFESVELKLPEGSLIAFYTDGLIETRDADLDAGMHRLGIALAQTGLPLELLCSTVVDTIVSGAPAEDDIALLLARTRNP